ncbi:hypothetical protein HZB89_00170 [archaeon]|nr:hypothetical protein [archaeon]
MEKAYIFALDSLLAVVLFMSSAAILPSLFAVDEQPTTSLIALNGASDVIDVMLDRNIIQGLNAQDINVQRALLMPSGLASRIEVKTFALIEGNWIPGQALSLGGSVPNDRIVFKGTKFFMLFQNNRASRHGLVDYWVWIP